MKSQSTIRTFDIFNDATTGFAFDRARAETIYQSAAGAVARYAGPIVLSRMRGARINLGDKPMKLFNFRLPSGPYSLVLTSRRLVDRGDQSVHVAGAGVFPFRDLPDGTRQYDSVARSTRSIISNYNNLADPSLTLLAAHEIGHSFMGSDHCPDIACVMRTIEPENEPRNAEILAQENPFCGNCIETLEDSGRQAAAALLLDGLNFNE